MSVAKSKKKMICDRCGSNEYIEACDDGAVYLCGNCSKDWEQVYKKTGLEAHSCFSIEEWKGRKHRKFMRVWQRIFYSWLGSKEIPSWEDCEKGEKFVLS